MAGKGLALSREAGLDKYLTVLKNDYDQIDYVLQMIPDPQILKVLPYPKGQFGIRSAASSKALILIVCQHWARMRTR